MQDNLFEICIINGTFGKSADKCRVLRSLEEFMHSLLFTRPLVLYGIRLKHSGLLSVLSYWLSINKAAK